MMLFKQDLGSVCSLGHLNLTHFRGLNKACCIRMIWNDIGDSLLGLNFCIIISLGYIKGHINNNPPSDMNLTILFCIVAIRICVYIEMLGVVCLLNFYITSNLAPPTSILSCLIVLFWKFAI